MQDFQRLVVAADVVSRLRLAPARPHTDAAVEAMLLSCSVIYVPLILGDRAAQHRSECLALLKLRFIV